MATLPTPKQLEDIATERVVQLQDLAKDLQEFLVSSTVKTTLTSLREDLAAAEKIAARMGKVKSGDESSLKEGLSILIDTRDLCWEAGDAVEAIGLEIGGDGIKEYAEYEGVYPLQEIAAAAGWGSEDGFHEDDFLIDGNY